MTQPIAAIPARHWAHIDEFTALAGMRLIFWICRVFGRWPARAVMYPVVLWYMATKPAARAASRAYLDRMSAFRGSPDKSGRLTVCRHFAAFAESLLDKMLLWSGGFETERVELHGHEQIAVEIAAQRGGLLICSHLGNLELCRILSRRAGLKLTVLIHTKHAEKFNRLLAELDPDSRLNLMQVTEVSPATAISLSEKIARGEFVAIAGDRIPVSSEPQVALASFLGAPAPFPIGPYILASLFQCPVYLLFTMRNGRASEIYFELFQKSIRLPRNDRDQALAELVAAYAARLEHFCCRAPLQWFNFYDFWRLPTMDTTDASR
ncbi:MAG TPA: acyltransferase [Candidatus Binatia bacterium]|jgi:predicted LPLAT superfamily acyltransferase